MRVALVTRTAYRAGRENEGAVRASSPKGTRPRQNDMARIQDRGLTTSLHWTQARALLCDETVRSRRAVPRR